MSNYIPKKNLNYAIIIPSYNRWIYLRMCLETLSKCRLADKYDCYILVDAVDDNVCDGATIKVCEEFQDSNPFKSYNVVKRSSNYGLTKNILNGLKETIGCGHDLTVVIENDLICSLDCLEVGVYALENGLFDADDIFSMCGCSGTDQYYSDKQDKYNKHWWHKSLLVYYPKKSWEYISDFVTDEYYGEKNTRKQEGIMKSYLYNKFADKIIKANPDPKIHTSLIKDGVVRYPLQAGLMNCIVLSNNFKQLSPYCSRAKHIGAVGWNQKFKQFSHVPNNIKQDIIDNPDSFFHVPGNDSWREDFSWKEIAIEE